VLADRFRAIDGVANVNIDGSLKRELSVLLHAEKLREYNVSVSEVTNALRNQNTNAPVGKVRSELDEKGIRLVGRIERPEDFQQVVVKRNGDDHRAPEPGGRFKDGFAESTACRTAAASRTSASRSPVRAKRRPCRWPRKCARWSRRSRRNCRRAPSWKSPATAATMPSAA
jgi:hypothetical protein